MRVDEYRYERESPCPMGVFHVGHRLSKIGDEKDDDEREGTMDVFSGYETERQRSPPRHDEGSEVVDEEKFFAEGLKI